MCSLYLFVMSNALFSTDAPLGWNALPTSVKQKFYDIGSKGDWTSQEAYAHLVPDALKDNVDEVTAWMDGSAILNIADKDVSRIISGDNGGEYSVDNTIMENASDNRSRGADNMSDSELAEVEADNAIDIEAIDAHFVGDEAAADFVLEDVVADGFDILGDIAAPAIAAWKIGTYAADKFEDSGAKTAAATIFGGLAALVATTTVGGWAVAGYSTYKISNLVYRKFLAA